jgi:hypothetical protein
VLPGHVYLLGAGGRGGCSVWKLRNDGAGELITSKKLGGGGGSRAASVWKWGAGVMFFVGFDDGRFEIWQLGGLHMMCPAPASSSCAVRSATCLASACSTSCQLLVGHTNGMVHMYQVSRADVAGEANFNVQLHASIRCAKNGGNNVWFGVKC